MESNLYSTHPIVGNFENNNKIADWRQEMHVILSSE